MKYDLLRKKMAQMPVFRPNDLGLLGEIAPHEPVQLAHWAETGQVLRLRKGLYTLPDTERRVSLSALWLANQLYFPSYISLESALAAYGMIPEAVGLITSVTARKTKTFKNSLGTFTYQKLSSDYFFGFKTFKTAQGYSYYMAAPEKAILDFIYLSIPKSASLDETLFLENYRFQNLNQLNASLLKSFLAHFTPPRVQKGGKILLKLMKEDRHD